MCISVREQKVSESCTTLFLCFFARLENRKLFWKKSNENREKCTMYHLSNVVERSQQGCAVNCADKSWKPDPDPPFPPFSIVVSAQFIPTSITFLSLLIIPFNFAVNALMWEVVSFARSRGEKRIIDWSPVVNHRVCDVIISFGKYFFCL